MTEKAETKSGNSGPGSHRLEKGVNRLASGAHSGIDAASDAAGPAIDRMASRAHRAVDKADDVATHAVEALDELGEKGEEWIATGAGYVRKHPFVSVGVAVAAGFILSRLLSSR